MTVERAGCAQSVPPLSNAEGLCRWQLQLCHCLWARDPNGQSTFHLPKPRGDIAPASGSLVIPTISAKCKWVCFGHGHRCEAPRPHAQDTRAHFTKEAEGRDGPQLAPKVRGSRVDSKAYTYPGLWALYLSGQCSCAEAWPFTCNGHKVPTRPRPCRC